ncbi:MAG: hypothetical protein II828_06310 [Clostridia bacterium]|nr:hypothetical protein [Clostridia bacterium]
MKKKTLISICIGMMLMVLSAVLLTGCGGDGDSSDSGKGTLNEEAGIVSFSDVSKELSFGIDLTEGDNPITITLDQGKLHVEIIKYDTADDGSVAGTPIYSGDFKKSDTVTVNVPESRYYTLNLSGEKATGTMQYK